MKSYQIIIIGVLTFFFQITRAQNTLSIASNEVVNNTNFDMVVSLNNTDAIAALQFDINFNKDAIELQTGHSLTTRKADHQLMVSNPSPGVVRVVLFSLENLAITGNNGALVTLKFKAKVLPGNFSVSATEIIASSTSGGNLTVSGGNATVKVWAPQLQIGVSEIDFGRIPLLTSPTRTLTVQNIGNQDLVLSGASHILPFGIQQAFPITVSPGSSVPLTITLNTTAKGIKTMDLSFVNNDPDPLRKIKKVTLKADVFAVNEIKIGSGSGEINTEVEIPVVIDNMEAFTAFQFDVTLPTGIEYVVGSIVKSVRFDGQSVTSSVVNGNILRIIAFSMNNTPFIGNSGEVLRFKLKPSVSSGTYPLAISSPIISYPAMGNILSQAYNGSISIKAPNLVLSTSNISYGNVPITETRNSVIRFHNYGDALLRIDQLLNEASELNFDIVLPIEIVAGGFKDINMVFIPKTNGSFVKSISIRHNGPTGQNLLNVNASIFSPNYLMVKNQNGYRNFTNQFEVELKNNDEVKAVQFDITLPTGFTLNINSLTATARAADFLPLASKLTGNTYRVIMYSPSNTPITKGSGSIVILPTLVDVGVSLGDYSFTISNVIISDMNNQNISSIVLETGKVAIVLAKPIIEKNQVFSIAENSDTGTLIGSLKAIDPDGGTLLNWKIVSGNENNVFSLNESNGKLTVNDKLKLNYEEIYNYELLIAVSSTKGTTSENEKVTITVTNLNELTPIDDATISLAENTAIGALVKDYGVTDPEGDVLTYTITSGNNEGFFTIDSAIGKVTTVKGLDYETTKSYVLIVSVTDGNLTDTAQLTINVIDVNEPPVVNDLSITLAEDKALGTIGTLIYNDPEAASLSFTITAGNESGTFSVSNTGVISLVKSLDYETKNSYLLTISVNDGTSVVTAKVTITVTNVNELTPIEDATVSLSEGTAIGTLVKDYLVVDPEGDVLAYSITSGNGDGVFSINSSTGKVTTVKGLDYELTKSYALTISVTDGSLTDTAILTINILDINEPPVINDLSITLSENAVLGVIGTLIYNDPEAASLTFSITAGNESGAFSVSNTGVISLVKSLDYETKNSYLLTISVNDGTSVVTAKVTITVTNVNELTPIEDATVSLSEGTAIGTLVKDYLVVDPEGDVLAYSITSGNGDGVFSINSSTGKVTTVKLLNYLIKNNYSLTILVTDGKLSDTAVLSINVLNNGDSDGDGVINSLDQCPSTPVGVNIDYKGCPTLLPNNFKLEVTNPTCQTKTNGMVKITGTATYNYTATMDGKEYTFANNILEVLDLAPKVYTICVKVPALNNYTQCFDFEVKAAPGIGARTTMDTKGNRTTANIEIESGTAPFLIEVNGKTVEITYDKSVSVSVQNGDLLVVKSSVACEGSVSERVILLNELTAYPNPTSDFVEVFIPTTYQKSSVMVQVINNIGKTVLHKEYKINGNKILIPMVQLSTGLYMINVQLEKLQTIKVIKK